MVSNNVAADPRYLTNQLTTGSELIGPIVLRGCVVGTLDVEDRSTDAFNADDQHLFERSAAALVCALRVDPEGRELGAAGGQVPAGIAEVASGPV